MDNIPIHFTLLEEIKNTNDVLILNRMFFSCNGFSTEVSEAERRKLNGIKPLWNDVLRDHSGSPFHAMLGGGDQLYCDTVLKIPSLASWLKIEKKEEKRIAPWTNEMNEESHRYYFDTYMENFQLSGFKEAMASIPYNFVWDDHDIFDGYGSYPDHLNNSAILRNIFVAAQRFYLLFQHHTNLGLARQDGYIGVQGHSSVRQYGPSMAIVAIDVRTERTLTQIVKEESWNMIWRKVESLPRSTRHLIIGATIPLAYPRIKMEAFVGASAAIVNATAGAINVIGNAIGGGEGSGASWKSAFQKTGAFSSIVNAFGEPELMDDLNDHWTAENHMNERNYVIQNLQRIAKDQGLRVTFISGDVHCCGVGKLYTAGEPSEDRDHRYMPQIVSSAIGNVPPPAPVINLLNRWTTELKMDDQTMENMCPLFNQDVKDQDLKTERFLMGRRNWCRITVPPNNPTGLKFDINVEIEHGNPSGNCKTYSVVVPCLSA